MSEELKKQLEASERREAVMRSRLEELLEVSEFIDNEDGHQTKAIKAALASDAGKDYVPRGELDAAEQHVNILRTQLEEAQRQLGRPFHEGKQIGWEEGKQPLEERKEVIMNELKIMLALAGAQGWKSPEEFQELRTQLEEAQNKVEQLREALHDIFELASRQKSNRDGATHEGLIATALAAVRDSRRAYKSLTKREPTK